MNTKQIDSVLELARTNNFTKAAENLYVTQPALTYTIHTLEDEVGFTIFERSGKGARLTLAGEYFVRQLRSIKNMMTNTIEYSRNLSNQFSDSLTLSLPLRSALLRMPEIIKRFKQEYPEIHVNIIYEYGQKRIDDLLNEGSDLTFMLDSDQNKVSHTKAYPIYESPIYFVCKKGDPLENREMIYESDLEGKTMLESANSASKLRKLQNQLFKNSKINFMNAPNHETTLTYISLGWAYNLIPGFLNDSNPEFVWIPYDYQEKISCDLLKREDDHRDFVERFIMICKEVYQQ